MVRRCAVCGAQNSRYAASCFNCQTDLEATQPPPRAGPKPRPARVEDARWTNISRVAAPLNVRVPLARERFSPYPVQPVTGRRVFERFLSVFVERAQAQRDLPQSVARFDPSAGSGLRALERLLSVFVERK
jgi:hypothetical protein